MLKLKSYVAGAWHEATGGWRPLLNPATEEVIAETSTEGLDFEAALKHAREVGGPALQALTFNERAAKLKELSKAIYEKREELLDLAMQNGGNTRGDAKFDVDGATATLSAYAYFGKNLGTEPFLLDGDFEQIGRNPRYAGRHLLTPLKGVAVHINAYNFPAWGFAEKAAVALLAGMPVISKPATSTALVAHRMMEIIVGSVSFIAGSTGNLLSLLGSQDVMAFTGSGHTAAHLRSMENMINRAVRVNVEADSLNAAVVGHDVEVGGDTWSMALREVGRDVTQKTGQKCTAIRRVLVSAEHMENFVEALKEQVCDVKIGNPMADGVRMGPLVSKSQVEDVRAGIEELASQTTKICGESHPTGLPGVEDGKGYFVTPHIFRCDDIEAAPAIHKREVFGPVVSVIAYKDAEHAADIISRGEGGLVSSLYTDDRAFAKSMLL
ncbi:MAG: 3,4-dehydroadipyl-CoA semialdehyde dehydrogenase, partial [Planctomycetota bacterium]|nr:3,4-dehydroadipyl-CoA semialdehyde dehydrogenase [Planctomycetota bacterium]